jgi:hypothetical protein
MCPAVKSSKDEMKAFIDAAVRSIADRLNSAAPGANLNPQDAYAIMQLCPFETVAKEKISPFCFLFSRDDFKIYEYAGDLEKFYNTGYSSHFPFTGTPLTFYSSGTAVHWEPFKVSGTSTNSSDASQIPPHTTAYKPTAPCFLPLQPFHSIGRCTSISRMTT